MKRSNFTRYITKSLIHHEPWHSYSSPSHRHFWNVFQATGKKKKRAEKKVVQQEAAKAKEMKNLKLILLLSYKTWFLPEPSSRAGLSPWWAQFLLWYLQEYWQTIYTREQHLEFYINRSVAVLLKGIWILDINQIWRWDLRMCIFICLAEVLLEVSSLLDCMLIS